MTRDLFPTQTVNSSLREFFPLATGDDVILEKRPKAIMVDQTATLVVKGEKATDDPVPLPNLVPGVWHPISPAIIMTAGTTGGVTIVGGR